MVEALKQSWLSWAQIMTKLRGDPAKAHVSTGVERFCRAHGCIPDIMPGDAHNAQGIVERRILAWMMRFSGSIVSAR